MAIKMALPKIGVNMTEAVITKWLIKPGDKLCEGDAVAEAETDKATQEILSTSSGTVAELLFSEGDTVQCFEDYVILIEEGEEYTSSAQAAVVSQPEPAVLSEPDLQNKATLLSEPVIKLEPISLAEPVSASNEVVPEKSEIDSSGKTQPVTQSNNQRIRISPRAKKFAVDNNVDIAKLSPAEPGLRIVQSDVERYLYNLNQSQTAGTGSVIDSKQVSPLPGIITPEYAKSRNNSFAAIKIKIDAADILSFRDINKNRGTNLSTDAILIKIIGLALREFPAINSVHTDGSICIKQNVNIIVATDSPEGLKLPMIQNADAISMMEINDILAKITENTSNSFLSTTDVYNGTFTFINSGAFGVDEYIPSFFASENCLLSVSALQNEFIPDENCDPVLTKNYILTLVFDQNFIDGAIAAKFLKEIKENAENLILLVFR